MARAMVSSRAAETRYVQDLRGVFRGVHVAIVSALEPRLGDVARHDAITKWGRELDGISIHVMRQVPAKLGPLFDRMAKTVDTSNRDVTRRLLGVTPSDSGIATEIAKAREANIRLVQDAARAYAQDVRDLLEDPESFGLRVEELRDRLLERGNVSESRAALIARDQTLKLNGEMSRVRQTNAGVTEYTWNGVGDERERESHRSKEGQTFAWSSPPPDTGHPGQDFQCRCVPLPVVPELADLD